MGTLSAEFTAFAAEKRVDLLGIAPIERFDEVPANHHPASIFPEVRSVVVIGKRITRGTLRGIEEGTQLDLWGQYGQSWLRDRVLAITTITLATWLEDQGWEAVPIQELPPEMPPSGIAVSPDRPAPNVIVDVQDAAVRAGLGEIGFHGELLTRKFGPRQRLQLILTEAELEPTPMAEPGLCDLCGECVDHCPLGAMNPDAATMVTKAGQTVKVSGIDYSICKKCRNGASANPFHPAGRPDRLAALCVRTCVDHLERKGLLETSFATPFRQRPAWQIDRSGDSTLREES